MKDKDGGYIRTAIDEKWMLAVKDATNGEYHHLVPGLAQPNIRWASALGGSRSAAQVKLLFQWPIGAALVLLFILSLTGLSRKRDVL